MVVVDGGGGGLGLVGGGLMVFGTGINYYVITHHQCSGDGMAPVTDIPGKKTKGNEKWVTDGEFKQLSQGG